MNTGQTGHLLLILLQVYGDKDQSSRQYRPWTDRILAVSSLFATAGTAMSWVQAVDAIKNRHMPIRRNIRTTNLEYLIISYNITDILVKKSGRVEIGNVIMK